MPHPTFGWVISPSAATAEAGRELMDNNLKFLREIRGAFDTVWVEDHFQWGARPLLEGWTTLAFLAAQHPEFRFGPLVLGQSYRNPALTAKMFATLHWLTGGRLIAGIGAGWKRDEYDAYNWPFPADRVRLEQLDETIQIIRRMWTESPASFQGRHYSIHQAYCEPRPDPPPPLLVAGAGEKLTLRLAARYADWMNIPFLDPETTRRKLAALDGHCRSEGRQPASILRSYYAFIAVSRDGAVPEARPGIHRIEGTPEAVAEQLQEFVEMGIEHFMVRFTDFPGTEGLELFRERVMPILRPA
jgi:alkanesulfonate monooxygenase SsuD/methylene tetrahydromethanopterin reductase-like flavin-dependent oxidoreductase (luciferase family)